MCLSTFVGRLSLEKKRIAYKTQTTEHALIKISSLRFGITTNAAQVSKFAQFLPWMIHKLRFVK
jgi:hypothetical protein